MIYLASASPRRQELLRQAGIAFEALPSGVGEVREPHERPEDYVLRVALDKARAVAARVQREGRAPRPVLGADTEVVLGDEVFGKPRDRERGLAMLRRLAGCTHEVLTGLALVGPGGERTALSRSRVTFGPMTEAEILGYWDSGEPADKAGAYAVQGRAALYIARIEGSYSGIMGLPLHELGLLLDLSGRERR
jgi:septum formation protein